MSENKKKGKTRTPNNLEKDISTVFPSGFGIRKVEGDIIVIEFIDLLGKVAESPTAKIIGSFALPSKKANQLAERLREEILSKE